VARRRVARRARPDRGLATPAPASVRAGRPRELDTDTRRSQSRGHTGDHRVDDLRTRLDEDRPPADELHERAQAQADPQYGLTGTLADFQEDHLISLELGGDPTDPHNLWPEPIKRATEVDRIENELNEKVCEGSLSLAEAQRRESQLKHDRG